MSGSPGSAAPGALAMVVDDDSTMRLMLQSTLAKAGLRTAAFADGRSALAAFESLGPDLVLLDIGLPDADGCTVCNTLRSLPGGRDTPVLMLTGRDDAASVERSFVAGATDFIAKPINWEILVHRVRYILRLDLRVIRQPDRLNLELDRIAVDLLRSHRCCHLNLLVR